MYFLDLDKIIRLLEFYLLIVLILQEVVQRE